MRVIIDTNIVFSAILNSQSRIGNIILKSDAKIKFYSSKYLQFEIQKHFNKIKNITNLPDSELIEIIEALYSKIHFISEEIIPKEIITLSENLTEDIDFDDVIFIALALHLNCKLWTGDKELIKGLISKGFKKFISTQELLNKLNK